ncbi:stage 0 sporulation protein [bacterium]|nr:stage 0 sporulation protein [bacterium]
MVVVRFRGHRKGFYHNRRRLEVAAGGHCLVEADRGCDLGLVSYVGPGPQEWWDEARHQGLLEIATSNDLARLAELEQEERRAWSIGLEKIAAHGLPMQLVGVERRWDRGKLTYYFLADGRVDFRALVRDLAGVFRTRIELRQIGVRDEARLKGGLGVCGREFCCANFLDGFDSVALRMAKNQQLPLNPSKLSGPCGRLRCCLAFEDDQYRELLDAMPRAGGEVCWQGRCGRARKLDPLRELVTVEFADGGDPPVQDIPAGELDFDRPATRRRGGDGGDDDGRRRRPRSRKDDG